MPSRPKVAAQAHRELPTSPPASEHRQKPAHTKAEPGHGGGGKVRDRGSASSSSSGGGDVGTHVSADEAHRRTLVRRVFVHYSKPLHTTGAPSKPPASAQHDEHPHKQLQEGKARQRTRMTNWHFIMACRDSGLLQSADISRTDCDIVFSKLKDSHNTLSPKRFRLALEMLAERAHKPADEFVAIVVKHGEELPEEPHEGAQHRRGSSPSSSPSSARNAPGRGSAPQVHAPSQQKRQHHTNDELPATFRRLTDPQLYTGAHRYRFDEAGAGKGLAGRDSVPKGEGIPASTTKQFETAMRSESDVRGVPLSYHKPKH